MGNLFKNKQNEAVPQSQTLASKYANARHNILLIVGFTLINIILLVTQSNTYFLFSAYLPYLIVDLGMALCGMYSAEYYGGDLSSFEFLGREFLVGTLVVAAAILLLYLLSWIFSNKGRVGWMIFALVFFAIDTVAMLLLTDIALDMIMDIVFHVWVIVSLVSGIFAYYKLRKLPEEPAMPVDAPVETVQEEALQQKDEV